MIMILVFGVLEYTFTSFLDKLKACIAIIKFR
jgi:hypothetical protein